MCKTKISASSFLAILILSQTASSVSITQRAAEDTQVQVNYTSYELYVFVSEWAGTVCKFTNCSVNFVKKQHFNLHGLWPNYKNGSWPQNCTQTPLNYEALSQALKVRLDEYWSGLYNSQQKFLAHEWGRHGTCWNPTYGVLNRVPTALRDVLKTARASTVQSPPDYLKLVVSIIEYVYDFHDIFGLSGILPSNDKTYSLAEMKEAVSSKLGIPSSGFALKCKLDKKGENYLDSVWLCLDRNYQPVGGCGFLKGNCGDQIHYPLDQLGEKELVE